MHSVKRRFELFIMNRFELLINNGSTSTYTYNTRKQVLEVEKTCVCGILISDYQYTYNDAGLITKEVAKENLFTSNVSAKY